MSSDAPDDNKTRFRAIPKPGGRGAVPAQPQYATDDAAVAPQARDIAPAPARAADQNVMPVKGAAAALSSFEAHGANRLMSAASALLALIGRLRTTLSAPNIAQLRQQAEREVRSFESRLTQLGYGPDLQIPARYVLCTAIDQAVFNTPWGAQSGWSQEGLLVSFHRETWGGEKFFEILDRASADPRHYIDLLELQYACLMLGFGGRYQNEPDGAARLTGIQHDLFRTIRDVRGTPPAALSDHWQGHREKPKRLIQYIPVWVAVAAAVAVVFLTWLILTIRLNVLASPVAEKLTSIGIVAPTYAAPATPTSAFTTLKALLAPEEQAGSLVVEEADSGALVSLTASDLFGSGSATLNPAHAETLRHVASALDQVPGRVVIVGHTDDQPLRSFTFADNIDLSRERAYSVKRLMTPLLQDPARLSSAGMGATRPRYQPASLPENRARNRRVEIQLLERPDSPP